MRNTPPALQAKLDSGVTALCRCWLIERQDGVTQGFTDHDEDIALGDVTCRAGTGMSGSEATQKHGLAVDSSELSGGLNDDTLNEDDLAVGLYDAAGVALWLVDWSEPSLRVIRLRGTEKGQSAEGHALLAEGSQMVFYGTRLPALPANRTYQLWLVRSAGPAIASAGTFNPDAANRATLQFRNAALLSGVTALAITDEPAGGSAQPTGHKWMIGS